MSEANVVLLLLDAQQDISEQDAHIARFYFWSLERALVVVVSTNGMASRVIVEMKLRWILNASSISLTFANFHFISALKSTGIGPLMKSIDAAYGLRWLIQLSTPKLTRALIEAVEHQQPKRKGSIRPKMRYAHQGGQNPQSSLFMVMPRKRLVKAINDIWKNISRETFSRQELH